tara:strand:- start:8777 stop:9676 length:900 start_codon:yes stop_codon:yes gene_type:complete
MSILNLFKKDVMVSSKKNRFSEPTFRHIHQVSSSYVENFYEYYAPVFVLNTGRSGSSFMQKLLANFPSVDSHHEAHPNLMQFPNYAFHNQSDTEILKKVFNGARFELLLNAAIRDTIYVESNQCLVFFIHQIKDLFPKAKFVHLTRHPGDFVRSAITKGWHKNDSIWESGRIQMSDQKKWVTLDQIEKLSWVYTATHEYIEDFKSHFIEDVHTVRLEDLTKSTEVLKEMLSFMGVNDAFDEKALLEKLSKKVNQVTVSDEPSNMFKLAEYPRFKDWNMADQEKLKNFTGSLSKIYDYEL